MQTIEQARTAAKARAEARRAEEKRNLLAHAERIAGRNMALRVDAGMPLVRAGGNGLRDLREDAYDAARNVNGRAGVYGICETYATAMMGGEPFAAWN